MNNPNNLDQMADDSRRYDVDWLRSIAFLLLIFYHIGMFYVEGWGWHVKSEYQSQFLGNIILLVNQWRMPLIFLISGAALSLVEHKIGLWQLFKMRFVRVFIPLVIGMYLIVPPQLYYQLVQNEGFSEGYLNFYQLYIDVDTNAYPKYQHPPAGLITWNHLWYLPYLFSYTLVYMLIKPILLRINWPSITAKLPVWLIFLIPALMFTYYSIVLEPLYPKTHALFGDWYNHAYSFTAFMMGYILVKSNHIWQMLIEKRKMWFGLALVGFALTIARSNRLPGFDINYMDASDNVRFLIHFIWRANTVLWLFAVIGFSGFYLNKRSAVLSYLNEAVLPWYILHQTVIIIVAMNLAKYSLGGFAESLLVTLGTFLLCLIGYELIKRNRVTRFMFGMKG